MIRDWLDENPVVVEDGLRHDKWCAMMWPRLKLLHELLADTGSLWMTLDDNEAHRGKLLLDEIFGEENFVGNLVWRKKEGGGQTKETFVTEHDYIIGFRKSTNFEWIDEEVPTDPKAYKFETLDGKKYSLVKLEKWGSSAHAENRPTMTFAIPGPGGEDFFPVAPDGFPGRWRVGRARMNGLIKDGLVEWHEDTKGRVTPYEKIFLDYKRVSRRKARSIIFESGTTATASKRLTEIFGRKDVFETTKPVELLSQIFSHTLQQNGLILDSFAGSGTTAHAVLEANAIDGGSRRFIMVEMETEISNEITAERVRRVIDGYSFSGKSTTLIHREKLTYAKLKGGRVFPDNIKNIIEPIYEDFDEVVGQVKDSELTIFGKNDIEETMPGLGGTFTYCTLGEPIDLARILSGETLPAYADLAPLLFHMATNETLKPAAMRPDDFYVGASLHEHVWMIYRPDIDWLKSDAAALTLSLANTIFQTDPAKPHLVFAPARFVGQKVLRDRKINVAFVPFPDALYRVVREG
jgi:adenine-specific DNA-methyltransferase